MNRMIKVFLPLFLLLSLEGKLSASVNMPLSGGQELQNLSKLKSNFEQQKKSIGKLNDLIGNIKVNLDKKSNAYLQVIENRKEIENEINNRRNALQNSESYLKNTHKEVNKVLRATLISVLDKNSNSSNLLSAKLLLEGLKKKIILLEESIISNQALLISLKRVEDKYQNSMKNENELVQFLAEMDVQKRDLEEKLNQEISYKDKIYQQIKNNESKKIKHLEAVASEVSIALRFRSPLEEFNKEEHQKKGIYLSYNKSQPVYASMDGKVALSRGLSTFGKIVIIDHGDGIRSIVLGPFRPTVNPGMNVQSGSIVGYVDSNISQGKIYFEVRKDSKSFNTFKLMDKNFYKNLKELNRI